MKTRTTILTTILVILSQACTVFSIHPLYTTEDLLVETAILGTWKAGNETLVFDNLQNSKYRMTLMSDDTVVFSAGLINLRDQLFIDLFPYSDCDFPDTNDCLAYENLSRNFVPVHSFLKFGFENNQIILTPFDQDRLQTLFEQNRIRLSHEKVVIEEEDEDPLIVLTASTPELQKFIGRYGDDEEAFDEPTIYSRPE